MPIQTSIQLKTTKIRLNEQELARRFIFKEILKVILLATSGFRLGQTGPSKMTYVYNGIRVK